MDSFDFDINNYSIYNLIDFFKLSKNYTRSELDTTEKNMINNIAKNNDISVSHKNDLLNFIQKSKRKLLENDKKPAISSTRNNDSNNDNYETFDTINSNNNDIQNSFKNVIESSKLVFDKKPVEAFNNIGKILDPLSSAHQSLETTSIPSNSINGYGYKTIKENYIFNTRYRDDWYETPSTPCTFTLPKKINNIVSMTASAIQFPNTFYTFNNDQRTNQLYIHEDETNKEGIVILPEGNYTIDEFPPALEKAINEQIVGYYIPGGPNRFTVSINNNQHATIISNSDYTFTMNTIKKRGIDVQQTCSPFYNSYPLNTFDNSEVTLENYGAADYYVTMGFQIGYRHTLYEGRKSYTSESQFDPSYTDYVFFSVNEFATASITTTTYGVLPSFLVDKNILAVIPITNPPFYNTFDSGANFIYKKRTYVSPISIKKIQVAFLTRNGLNINLHQNEYAFCLEMETIYNPLTFP